MRNFPLDYIKNGGKKKNFVFFAEKILLNWTSSKVNESNFFHSFFKYVNNSYLTIRIDRKKNVKERKGKHSMGLTIIMEIC